jgi:hypothetical protein
VAQHWASPRESAEFPTGVKEALAMCALPLALIATAEERQAWLERRPPLRA